MDRYPSSYCEERNSSVEVFSVGEALGTVREEGGNIFLGLDIEELGMNALPSFPGEEFELLNEEDPEELSDDEFSSLSRNLCEDDALNEASKGLAGVFDCAARDLGLRLKAGRRPPLPLAKFEFTASPLPLIDPKTRFQRGGSGRC
jgi:hypothetical protein